jgi:hypothetical protein
MVITELGVSNYYQYYYSAEDEIDDRFIVIRFFRGIEKTRDFITFCSKEIPFCFVLQKIRNYFCMLLFLSIYRISTVIKGAQAS